MSASQPTFAISHQILILDAHLKKPLKCEQQKSITSNFIADFLVALGLEPLGPLEIYGAVDQRAPGWSFIQPITTSHISAHYFEKPGRSPHIRVDAYSCEAIDWKKLVCVCHRHFSLIDWRATFIDREIELGKPRKTYDLIGYGDKSNSSQLLSTDTHSTNEKAVA